MAGRSFHTQERSPLAVESAAGSRISGALPCSCWRRSCRLARARVLAVPAGCHRHVDCFPQCEGAARNSPQKHQATPSDAAAGGEAAGGGRVAGAGALAVSAGRHRHVEHLSQREGTARNPPQKHLSTPSDAAAGGEAAGGGRVAGAGALAVPAGRHTANIPLQRC